MFSDFVGRHEAVVGMTFRRFTGLLPKGRNAPFLEYDEETPEVLGANIEDLFAGVKSVQQQADAGSRVEPAQLFDQSIECLQLAILLVVIAAGGVFDRFTGYGYGHSVIGDQFRLENLVGIGDLSAGMLGDQTLVAMRYVEGEQVGGVDGNTIFPLKAGRSESLVANESLDHLHLDRFALLGSKVFQEVIDRVRVCRLCGIGAGEFVQVVQKVAAFAETSELPSAFELKDED